MARPKGAESRNTKFLMNKLRDMFGDDFDPIIKAAENAVAMQELATPSFTKEQLEEMDGVSMMKATESEFQRRIACVTAYDKIAQYVTPKLKAMEITGEDGGAIKIANEWTVSPVKPINET